MTTIQRFVLDAERVVIDTLNPTSPKGFVLDGEPEDEIHLRETILFRRLSEPVDDLINLQPEQTAWDGTKYKPHNKEAHAIGYAIYKAILASQLNTRAPAVSIQKRFDGTLKRQKVGLQQFTSLSLFCDDVERILRDLYGDIDSEALERILRSVLIIVEGFTQFVRKDLWQEHSDAEDWDYIFGIGLPDGYGISGSDHRRAHEAYSNLQERARAVRKNPSSYSRYTVASANEIYDEKYVKPDMAALGRELCFSLSDWARMLDPHRPAITDAIDKDI